ncbi:Retrovirus-related Pol polyprotein from transposon opus [Stylophora pistillata]|uniref:Retrovirus-related Pol polyprotein from transposon opus n=1 Tax=Stylophora pistillata TaxID=50429 RepID=A0A2B4RF45_STYPI|nr:Retrovirus-related Pol polyprotein from transposon opus [Stylophora pistillata]
MLHANEAVIRERHPIPTLEETLEALNEAAVFSKLDLQWGYHEVELHPESRVLTTFTTHKGLKRYKRLIFGLSSAPEMYQYVIQQTLQGIPGVWNISDDIIVFGSDQDSHDRNLELTLARLENKGLTLNREKCIFSVPELVFFGFKISADGIAADNKRVEVYPISRRKSNSNAIEDIEDGLLYQKHFGNDGYFKRAPAEKKKCEIDISFLINTDGVTLFRSSKFSIWPVYLVVNELPPNCRFARHNKIFLGLWFGFNKPDFLTFLQPLTQEFQEIYPKEADEITEYLKSGSILYFKSPDELVGFSNKIFMKEIKVFYPVCGVWYEDLVHLNQPGVSVSPDSNVGLQKKMGDTVDSRVEVWKKEIEVNKSTLGVCKEVFNKQQVPDDPGAESNRDCHIQIFRESLQGYNIFSEESFSLLMKMMDEEQKKKGELFHSNKHLESVIKDLEIAKLPLYKEVIKLFNANYRLRALTRETIEV